MSTTPPPDVLLISREWPARALLRAQLIEEGFDVQAVDEWAAARDLLRRGLNPRLLLLDLEGLPDPDNTLAEIQSSIAPCRVVIVGSATVAAPAAAAGGTFHLLTRPVAVRTITGLIARLTGGTSG